MKLLKGFCFFILAVIVTITLSQINKVGMSRCVQDQNLEVVINDIKSQ